MAGYRLIIFGLLFLLSVDALCESEFSKPRWSELKPQQQKILEPLAGSWDTMDSTRKKKWLGVAKRYPKMTAQEQQRIQSQMQNWNSLTSEQRRQARERYKKMEQLPAQKRQEIKQRWYEYEQLPGKT
jgi:hypothetical protein